MFAHNARQRKHTHTGLAQHRQQLGIGEDGAFVFRVLQVIGLDVLPQLLDGLWP